MIMSLKEFLERTTPTNIFSRGRGKKLKYIDGKLGDFHDPRHVADAEGRVYIAYLIGQGCYAYLQGHDESEGATTTMRLPVVRELGHQVWPLVQKYAFQHAESWDEIKQIGFGLRKGAFQQGPNNFQRDLKPLSGAYQNERDHFLAQGKAAPPLSASTVHQTIPFAQTWKTNGVDIPADLAAKEFDALSQADFQRWFDILKPGRVQVNPGSLALTGEPLQVLFCGKQERIGRMLLVSDGNLFKAFNQPLNGAAMYAMDKYGNLFYEQVMIRDRTYNGGEINFNHSSFNAGKEVICAGMIECQPNGHLAMISNESGHYKPTRAQLRNAIGLLAQENVNLTGTIARIMNPPQDLSANELLRGA